MQFVYDSYDRRITIKDADGNEIHIQHDAASHPIQVEIYGKANAALAKTLLQKQRSAYDEIGRIYRLDMALFLSEGTLTTVPTQLADNDQYPNDGWITSEIAYNRNSQITYATSPSPTTAIEQTQRKYDGAGRIFRMINAENDEIAYEYDGNSNPIRIRRTDRNPSNRIAEETFEGIQV